MRSQNVDIMCDSCLLVGGKSTISGKRADDESVYMLKESVYCVAACFRHGKDEIRNCSRMCVHESKSTLEERDVAYQRVLICDIDHR